MSKTEVPLWFNCEVISFYANSVEEINRELMNRGLDAADVISITHDYSHDYWYEVLCRSRTR